MWTLVPAATYHPGMITLKKPFYTAITSHYLLVFDEKLSFCNKGNFLL